MADWKIVVEVRVEKVDREVMSAVDVDSSVSVL